MTRLGNVERRTCLAPLLSHSCVDSPDCGLATALRFTVARIRAAARLVMAGIDTTFDLSMQGCDVGS